MKNENVEIIFDLLLDEEILYLENILNDKNNWIYNTYFNQPKQYFDSLVIDRNKLKNYYNLITQNGKYEIKETGIVVIEKDRQLKNSIHTDESDLSYVTYLNESYKGGEFIYFDATKRKNIIHGCNMHKLVRTLEH